MVRIKIHTVEILDTYASCRHEKLYETIQDKVIRSDDLPKSPQMVLKLFGDATVVLCTLSMLSNPKLVECGLVNVLPMKSLVIDEASQIDVFEFMVIPALSIWTISNTLNQHLFYKFSKDLTKVCFFGDPKQRESKPHMHLLSNPSFVSPALWRRGNESRNNF